MKYESEGYLLEAEEMDPLLSAILPPGKRARAFVIAARQVQSS